MANNSRWRQTDCLCVSQTGGCRTSAGPDRRGRSPSKCWQRRSGRKAARAPRRPLEFEHLDARVIKVVAISARQDPSPDGGGPATLMSGLARPDRASMSTGRRWRGRPDRQSSASRRTSLAALPKLRIADETDRCAIWPGRRVTPYPALVPGRQRHGGNGEAIPPTTSSVPDRF